MRLLYLSSPQMSRGLVAYERLLKNHIRGGEVRHFQPEPRVFLHTILWEGPIMRAHRISHMGTARQCLNAVISFDFKTYTDYVARETPAGNAASRPMEMLPSAQDVLQEVKLLPRKLGAFVSRRAGHEAILCIAAI